MVPRKLQDKTVLVCRVCQYAKEIEEENFVVKSNVKKTEETIVLVDERLEKMKTLPVTRAECPKCGNMEAYWWMLQTRRADEPPTRFFRCTKCGYTWREYD